LTNRLLNLLAWEAATQLSVVATTLVMAALTLLLLTISGVVLVTAAPVVVCLPLAKALVGAWGALVSHTGHKLLDDIGDLVHVSGVDCALATFLEMTLEVLLVLVVLVFKVAVLFDLVVVYVYLFVVNHEVLLVLGCLGLVGGLVANKGVGRLV